MSTLNFPDSPGINEIYTHASSGVMFKWDGAQWLVERAPAQTLRVTEYNVATVAANVDHVVAHGLDYTKIVTVHALLKCTSADQHFAVNQYLIVDTIGGGHENADTAWWGCDLSYTATQLKFHVNYHGILVNNIAASDGVNLDLTKWDLVFRVLHT